MQRLVIYLPTGACDLETQYKLRRHYPAAEFIGWWRDGAMMWQDALAKIEGAA